MPPPSAVLRRVLAPLMAPLWQQVAKARFAGPTQAQPRAAVWCHHAAALLASPKVEDKQRCVGMEAGPPPGQRAVV